MSEERAMKTASDLVTQVVDGGTPDEVVKRATGDDLEEMAEMALSRKYYIEFAKIVKELKASSEIKQALVAKFITLFKQDNPRFDVERFRKAANVPLDVSFRKGL